MELALKALADATSKFTIGSEAKEGSALSSDLSRSSDGEKLSGSKATSDENDSMMHESGCEDEELSKSNTSAGQGSEETHHKVVDANLNQSAPNSPFRKNRDHRETFVREDTSVKKRSPKKGKTITPDKFGRRTSNRLTPPSPPSNQEPPITDSGDGISL